jgi:hypothetical protein
MRRRVTRQRVMRERMTTSSRTTLRLRRPPTTRALPLVALSLAALSLGAGGCGVNDPVYFDCKTMGACDPDTSAPLEAAGDGTEVKQTLQLKFRVPTTAEEQERAALGAQLNYTVPSLREDQIHLELRYTITNLGDHQDDFSLNIDGASEFYRYDEEAVAAAFTAANMTPVVHGLYQAIPQTLGPGQVYQGAVREDDFHEMSLDLDAMGRWMAPFLSVLLNRSEVNPIGLDLVPPNLIRPALWEVTLRFNSNQHMTCQFLVRVRDDDQRLWKDGEGVFTPAPATFMPDIPPAN